MAYSGGGNPVHKAAVVIGVNTAGNLPVLNATSGAIRVGEWLRREGFSVKTFIDTKRPVIASDLFNAVAKLVDQGTLEQLVIYFSGHGFLNSGSEHWMLSGAPYNPNEAVSLDESTVLARRCGIPNVVFISDACRSVPQTFQASLVRGSLIFPIQPSTPGAYLDRFYATLPGDPALEMPLADSAGQYEGIYTNCFLDAFRRPDEDMVRFVTVDGAPINVVPNRNLRDFLVREVNRIAQEKSISLRQLPDSIVESEESYYIGRVRRSREGIPRRRERRDAEIVASVADIARVELDRVIGGDPGFTALNETGAVAAAARSGFSDSVALVRSAEERLDAFPPPIDSGVLVNGSEVRSAIGVGFDAVAHGPSVVDMLLHEGRVGSLILRFGDGSGTVLAAIDGYIANVVVDDGRVVSVSYLPSANARRWRGNDWEWQRLQNLRAKVAAAARSGVFRVDRRRAGVLADEIRYLKSIDPTLGLYAAYAYADAGLDDQVRSVRSAMRRDLDADLFDVAMLAGQLSGIGYRGPRVAPFCPMLSQGWGLLRVMGVRLAPSVSEAADHVRPALWTTFEPAGMEILEDARRRGELL
jgi:hypothetical protein